MRLCRQDDHPQNTKWCPSHRKITWRASKLERKRKICIVIPMVSEFSRVHLSAIPLGEMRACTFCGSRLRAWYLLVGDPYKPSFATVTGRGDNPSYNPSFGKWLANPITLDLCAAHRVRRWGVLLPIYTVSSWFVFLKPKFPCVSKKNINKKKCLLIHLAVLDPKKKGLNLFIFPTKYSSSPRVQSRLAIG